MEFKLVLDRLRLDLRAYCFEFFLDVGNPAFFTAELVLDLLVGLLQHSYFLLQLRYLLC